MKIWQFHLGGQTSLPRQGCSEGRGSDCLLGGCVQTQHWNKVLMYEQPANEPAALQPVVIRKRKLHSVYNHLYEPTKAWFNRRSICHVCQTDINQRGKLLLCFILSYFFTCSGSTWEPEDTRPRLSRAPPDQLEPPDESDWHHWVPEILPAGVLWHWQWQLVGKWLLDIIILYWPLCDRDNYFVIVDRDAPVPLFIVIIIICLFIKTAV